MKNNTVVVANTKGGVGKSIISTMILPLVYDDLGIQINIYEIDNNNTSRLENSKINFKSIKIEKTEDVINDVYFDLIKGKNTVNIVDCGGGDDSIHILEYLNKSDIKGIAYIVPVNDDIEQLTNALSTIEMIRKIDISASIYLVLNRCINIDSENEIKEQFISIFGSTKYGINSSLHLLKNIEILFVPNSPIFGILKNIYGTSLSDFVVEAEDLAKNIDSYRLEWVENGKEQFSENMKKYTFAKDVIALKKSLKSFDILSYSNEDK